MTIYTPGVNPVISLYNFWTTYLDTLAVRNNPRTKLVGNPFWYNSGIPHEGRSQPIGRYLNWYIPGYDTQDRPVLALGHRFTGYGTRSHQWCYQYLFTADGRFRMYRPSHSGLRLMEFNTPLAYNWVNGDRGFYVNPAHAYGAADLRDPLHPVPYFIMPRGGMYWYELAEHEHGWEWRESLDQGAPGGVHENDGDRARAAEVSIHAHGEWSRKLRTRRYKIMADKKREAQGLPKLSVRPATLRDGGTVLDPTQSAQKITDLLQVITPTPAVPLRMRSEEAHV